MHSAHRGESTCIAVGASPHSFFWPAYARPRIFSVAPTQAEIFAPTALFSVVFLKPMYEK